MFDDKLKATYCICNRFANWARLLCKYLEPDSISLHNRVLQLSQSLPVHCSAAGSDKTDNGRTTHLQKALACARELSLLLRGIANNGQYIDKTLLYDGSDIIDTIVIRLTDILPPSTTSPPTDENHPQVRTAQ